MLKDAPPDYELVYDVSGRTIHPGDILKLPHYVDSRTKQQVYMYKLVVQVDDDLQISTTGRYLYGLDPQTIVMAGSLQKAHKCRLAVVSNQWEIISGHPTRLADGGIQTWYERPRHNQEQEESDDG